MIMKNNTGSFQTYEDSVYGWMWNGHPVKMLDGTEVKINDKIFIKTPGFQKDLVNKSYNTAKSLKDTDKLVFRDMLQKLGYCNHKPTKGRLSGCYRFIKNGLDFDVRKFLNLASKGDVRRIEKMINPTNIIDIYTRLAILVGIKLSGHTDTLREASNQNDELYNRGEIQNEHQYRIAPNKVQTQ